MAMSEERLISHFIGEQPEGIEAKIFGGIIEIQLDVGGTVTIFFHQRVKREFPKTIHTDGSRI